MRLSVLLGLVCACACSCGGGPTGDVIAVGKISVVIEGAPAEMTAGQSYKFTAHVLGALNTVVLWSARLGNIRQDGTYTAPESSADAIDTITAASQADPATKAELRLKIKKHPVVCPPMVIHAQDPVSGAERFGPPGGPFKVSSSEQVQFVVVGGCD